MVSEATEPNVFQVRDPEHDRVELRIEMNRPKLISCIEIAIASCGDGDAELRSKLENGRRQLVAWGGDGEH